MTCQEQVTAGWGALSFQSAVAGADFLAALVASCFLGAFPPVDLRAVCLVLAIAIVWMKLMTVGVGSRYLSHPEP